MEGAIRDGDWKYLREAESPYWANEVLYNIKNDPTESTDLSETWTSVTKTMRDLFDELASSMVPDTDPDAVEGNPYVDDDEYVRSGWC